MESAVRAQSAVATRDGAAELRIHEALEAVVRKLGASQREERRAIPADADVIDVIDEEQPEPANSAMTPEQLSAALEIPVDYAGRVLQSPLGAVRESAARAATTASADAAARSEFGRWLPKDRYNVDQVPFNAVEGDDRTFDLKGDGHVWVAGSGKIDEGKRYCTLQLMVRAENGDKSKLYAEQPWPEICFRGKGLRVTAQEKAAWHPNVKVRFQPKAWYDDATCLKWAQEYVPAVTAEARRKGRESLLLLDNLHGQATDDFRDELRSRSGMVVHLLPAGVTDLVQLVDSGFGFLVKHKAGDFHAEWMVDNHERWTTGMSAWEVRAHITHIVYKAYDEACKSYDFEKNARKLGMLMTIGEEPYEGVDLQGLGPITFTDSDGGSVGDYSNDGDDEYDKYDAVSESSSAAALADADEDEEFDAVEEDSDVDDTDPQCAAATESVGAPVAPAGFAIDTSALQHQNDIIGKRLLIKLVAPPLEEAEYGWYLGTATRRVADAFLVRFTDGVVPLRYNKNKPQPKKKTEKKRKKEEPQAAEVQCELTPDKRSTSWCIVAPLAAS